MPRSAACVTGGLFVAAKPPGRSSATIWKMLRMRPLEPDCKASSKRPGRRSRRRDPALRGLWNSIRPPRSRCLISPSSLIRKPGQSGRVPCRDCRWPDRASPPDCCASSRYRVRSSTTSGTNTAGRLTPGRASISARKARTPPTHAPRSGCRNWSGHSAATIKRHFCSSFPSRRKRSPTLARQPRRGSRCAFRPPGTRFNGMSSGSKRPRPDSPKPSGSRSPRRFPTLRCGGSARWAG